MLREIFSGVRIPVVISLRWVPKGHTWKINLNWTKMKENCIPFVFLYKKCYSCIIIFLIFGLLLLPAWTSSTTISNHSELVPNTTNINCNSTDWIQRLILIVVVLSFISCNKHLCINNKPEHYGPVPYSANANSSIPDQIHILILTQVGCTFIMSVINLYINYNSIQIPISILVGTTFVICSIKQFITYRYWMQKLIQILVVLTFFMSIINLFISYKHEYCDSTQILILILITLNFIICIIKPVISYRDSIQILILILVGLNFIISAVDLSSNYKHYYCGWIAIVILVQVGPTLIICSFINNRRNNRKKHDAEQGLMEDEEGDPVPYSTNVNSSIPDQIHILILTQVGCTFIISVINLYINYNLIQIPISILMGPTFIICSIKLFSTYRYWMQKLIQILVVLTFFMSIINLFISYKHEYCDSTQILILILIIPNIIICIIKPVISYRDLIQILILMLVGLNFIMSAINLSSNYKHDYCGWVEIVILVQVGPTLIICSFINDQRIHRKKHDAEQGELQESNRKLQELIEQCQKELEWRKARNNIDDITLAADTAHPNLSIAGDKKRLKHETQPQKVPQTRERFDSTVCVLGSQGFSSGKHYWEVDVESSTDWDLGVARKSIERKGKLSLSPKEGFWVLGFSGRDYWAKTDPWTRVMVQKNSKKIGVYLNYQERQVTFYNVTDMSVLFTFSDCSFSGEVCPFFKNSHKDTTLKICSIKEEE